MPSPSGEGVCGPDHRRMRGKLAVLIRLRAAAGRLPLIRRCGATAPLLALRATSPVSGESVPEGEGLKELIMENNAILSALTARKSVRVFTDEAVTAEERAAILHAAFQAPTAGNQQLYTILNITDPALKATLADLCDHQPFIAKAPLVLVFLADCRRWLNAYHAAGIEDVRKPGAGDLMLAMADTCIAAQNAVVAAESMGIGSCYIGDVIENAEPMREALRLPEYVVPACMLVFGRPTEQQQRRPKPARFAEAAVVCENTYRDRTPDELRADFTARAAATGQPDYDFNTAVQAFCKRKYESDFSKEMTRSAHVYWDEFE